MTKPLPNPFMEVGDVAESEVSYGPTLLGQLLYDVGFSKLTDSYLARKHKMPIADIRSARAAFKRGFAQSRALEKKKGRRR